MRILNWSDIEEKASSNYEKFIYECEYHFKNQVNSIADDIYKKANCKIIFVCGPSSSGKTTFTNILANRLENKGIKVHRVSTDDFFKDRKDCPKLPNGKYDFDSINAMDLPILKKTIKLILAGGNVNLPSFNFKTGIKTLNAETINVQESDITIVEGIHALNPEVTGVFDINSKLVKGVFIRPALTLNVNNVIIRPNDLRLIRRSIRDYYTRGYSLEDTANQWHEVLAAEKHTIYPFIDLADYTVDSCHPYELFVYKNCFGSIIENTDLPEYQNIKKALNSIEKKPRVAIPKKSLLNEFDIWPDEKC